MKKVLFGLSVLFIISCSTQPKAPDVSHIQVSLATERFEKDFFSLDTTRLDAGFQSLYTRYAGFTQDFLFNILGTSPDSAVKDARFFLKSYRDLYEDSKKVFGDFSAVEKQVKQGLQYVRYYFPQYKAPSKLITFIGPINSYGNIITQDALAVGLQLYMGKDYPLYQGGLSQELYPPFLSHRFEPAYIPVNCMKNVIDDMFPNKTAGTLVDQMVEAGKRQYVLERLLPGTADTLLTGYTARQLEQARSNEKNTWSFFVQNGLLFSTDPNMTRDYLSEGPNTQALGPESPANIGQFVGTQIVNRWMEKNKDTPLATLMQTPARKIFDEAKYKP